MGKINVFVLGFLKFIDNVLKPLISCCFRIYYRKLDVSFPLPKCSNELLLTPGHQLAKKIRNREITSEQLVTAYIDRIKQIQPLVNCVVQDRFDEALKEAKEVDKILSLKDIPEAYTEKNAPLLGVPFSCKECIWVKGMSNNSGLVCRKDIRAPEDAIVVKYMKDSGAILTCLTNTSEVCMWLESSNYVTGTTRNPYNLSRIVGGSSGGEGCIVSACGAIWGIGSDIGGSIRMPSFFNGVYGHKPSKHLISNQFQFPQGIGMQEDMLGTGPICRYASDLKLMFKILSGPKYSEFEENFEKNIDLKKLKFYYVRDLQGNVLVTKPSEEVEKSLERAIKFLETDLEVEVREIRLRKLRSSFQMWTSMMNNGKSSSDSFSTLLNDGKEPINPYKELFRSIIGIQDKHTLPAISLAITERFPSSRPEHHIDLADSLREEIQNIIQNDGIIIFPSFPVIAPYHNQALFTNSLDFIYYGILNAMGFPVTQIPMGLSKEGLPTGIQLVANHNMDHLTIKLAEYFESNLVGWVPPF
ncbi:fatty-acid amide hydrolase 2 [Brachionus plicatilis]|uniref:Fatty-acid amide hydrolase 2 n=1 Tax=Brachionus plicatilis TaxID=10195 RepID=A0A3M7RLZ1_BRAPC|nr:fatty-acid amide hydrolase 2 [Brachionus plicatilis]